MEGRALERRVEGPNIDAIFASPASLLPHSVLGNSELRIWVVPTDRIDLMSECGGTTCSQKHAIGVLG